MASRRELWQANYEVAELTGMVGKPADALAAHRQVLAAREALAAESPGDPEIKAAVARSLMAVAGLLRATGQTREAEAINRKAEALLVEEAQKSANAGAVRAALAACRSRLGLLLSLTGRTDEALSVYRLARGDQEAPAAAPGASNEARRDLADTIHRIGDVLSDTGKPADRDRLLPCRAGWPGRTRRLGRIGRRPCVRSRDCHGTTGQGGHAGLSRPQRLPDRIGPGPAPQPARFPAPDDGPRDAGEAVRAVRPDPSCDTSGEAL